jgi:sec-independent protein translocase protein TatC
MDKEESFWEHLDAFRSMLIRIFLMVLVGAFISLCFYKKTFAILTAPIDHIKAEASSELNLSLKRIQNTKDKPFNYSLGSSARLIGQSEQFIRKNVDNTYTIDKGGYLDILLPSTQKQLAIFSPIEGLTSSFTVAFWSGLLISSPFWLATLLFFVSPGLNKRERRLLLPFFCLSTSFIALGLLFALKVTIPAANHFLYQWNAEIGSNIWSLSNYLSYTVLLLVGNALAFEIAILCFFLVHLGVLKAKMMRSKRRYVIVGIFVMTAILTPPDVFSQVVLAIPLLASYEAAIVYASLRHVSVD